MSRRGCNQHFYRFLHRMVLPQTGLISPELKKNPVQDVLDRRLSWVHIHSKQQKMSRVFVFRWSSRSTAMFASYQLHHNYKISRCEA